MACIIKSTTLVPGDIFVLPPGATMIGASDVESLESTCVDLTDLEEMECYIAKVVIFDNDNGTGEWFEGYPSYQCISGYSLNGVQYDFATCGTPDAGYYHYAYSPGHFLYDLRTAIPGIIDSNGYGTNQGSTYNYMFVYQILTVPSIGDNLEIMITTSAESWDTNAGYRVKFVKRADATGTLPTSLCADV